MSDLPPYWRCKESRSRPGEFYYINVKTRVSTWIHPAEQKKKSKDEHSAKDDSKKDDDNTKKHKSAKGKWTPADQSNTKEKKDSESELKSPAESTRLVLTAKRRSLQAPAKCFTESEEKRKSPLQEPNTSDTEETPSKKIKTPAKTTEKYSQEAKHKETNDEVATPKAFLPRSLEIDKTSSKSSKAKKRDQKKWYKKVKKLLAEKNTRKESKESQDVAETSESTKVSDRSLQTPISTIVPESGEFATATSQDTKLQSQTPILATSKEKDCRPLPSRPRILKAIRGPRIIKAIRGKAKIASASPEPSPVPSPVSMPGLTPVPSLVQAPEPTPVPSPVSIPGFTSAPSLSTHEPTPQPSAVPIPALTQVHSQGSRPVPRPHPQFSVPVPVPIPRPAMRGTDPTVSPIAKKMPFSGPSLLVRGTTPALSPIPLTGPSTAIRASSAPNQSVMPSTSGTFTTPTPHIHTEETDMDVDIDVLVFSDLMSVRQCSPLTQIQVPEGVTDKPTQPPSQNLFPDSPSTSCSEPKLYIIVDTNVLMHDLKFVDDLKDRAFPSRGRPTLVIPWVVMQELDSLKDGKTGTPAALRTTLLARHPVNYLNQCLQSKHPRIICQTPTEDAVADGLRVECNDDRVLTCCLQWKKKHPSADIRLLTLDKNLRNKAIVSGIDANSIVSLISWSEEGKSSSDEDDSGMGDESNMNTKDEAAERILYSLTDEILCELKTVLRDSLSVVLETEMHAVYDDLWTNIVYRKPPWSLYDLLECYNKHWIAVFGDIIGRQKKHYLDNLMAHFKPGATATYQPHQLKVLITECGNLLQPLGRRSSYSGALCVADQKLQVLYKVSRDVATGTRQPAPLSELAAHYGTHYTERENATMSTEHSDITDNASTSVAQTSLSDTKRNQVQNTFQSAWENIIFCKDLLQTHMFGSDCAKRAEYVTFFCRLVPVLMAVNKAYAKMLEVPVGSNQNKAFVNVSDALDLLAQEAYIQPWTRLEAELLQEFYAWPGCREVLENGYRQLQEILQGFDQCWVRLTPEEQTQMPT